MGHNVPTLVLLLLEKHLAAWLVLPGDGPREQPIEGTLGWLPCPSGGALVQGLDDVSNRLRHERGGHITLELCYDAASDKLLTDSLTALAPRLVGRDWQIQRWERLAARCGRLSEETARPPRDWIAQKVLPLLLAQGDAQARQQMQADAQREHASLTELLQAKRAALQRQNEDLRMQNAAMRQVGGERLIAYLPALFARVFNEVGGHDLALLCGRVEPYVLPNPYPEPSPETLHRLQREFRALPREVQRQVVDVAARLPQRRKLKERPEMCLLIQQLESEGG